jgi:MFS family permease
MNPDSRNVAYRFFGVSIARTFAFSVADAFIILYLIAQLTYQEFGVLIAARFLAQAILDYPTGALSDLVGQRRVLGFSYICRIGAIVLLILSNSFAEYLVYYIIGAISASQESGALESWFDNQYQVNSDDTDPEKAIFGAFQGKIGSANFAIRAVAYLIGGTIASVYSRKSLFVLYLGLIIIVFVLILKFISMTRREARSISFSNYIRQLREGIQFYFSRKSVFLYFTGLNVVYGSLVIWGFMILFPYYEAYSGSDENLGVLRSILLLTGFLWFTTAASKSRSITNIHRPLFLALVVGFPVFFAGAYFHYIWIPPANQFQLFSFISMIILFQVLGMTQPLIGILNSRLQIQLVPNEIRNSVYSLSPTIISFLSAIIAFFAGDFVEIHGLEGGILLSVGFTAIGALLFGIGIFQLAKEGEIEEIIVEDVPVVQKKPKKKQKEAPVIIAD